VFGQNLTLECAAEGWPVPELTWAKYGGHLPTGRYSTVLGIYLEILLVNVSALEILPLSRVFILLNKLKSVSHMNE